MIIERANFMIIGKSTQQIYCQLSLHLDQCKNNKHGGQQVFNSRLNKHENKKLTCKYVRNWKLVSSVMFDITEPSSV